MKIKLGDMLLCNCCQTEMADYSGFINGSLGAYGPMPCKSLELAKAIICGLCGKENLGFIVNDRTLNLTEVIRSSGDMKLDEMQKKLLSGVSKRRYNKVIIEGKEYYLWPMKK